MTGPDRRPQSAGQLLRDITFNPLDPGYHAAARRRSQDGQQRPASKRFLSGPVVVALVVLGILVGGAVVQLRSVPTGANTRAVLLDQVEQRNEAADAVAAANLERLAQIERLESELLTEDQQVLARSVDRLAVPAGAVRLTGPGVRVTLDDAPQEDGDLFGEEPGPDLTRVLDLDLQQVVNGLWAAGAEGIAVNGQRLTSLSAIRGAGSAILVDYRPLARPYVVEAIGDPDLLAEEVTTGGTSVYLGPLERTYGMQVAVDTVDSVTLPQSSSLSLDHAAPYRPTPDLAPTPTPVTPGADPRSRQ
jgi:uncharacterized protein YlxW (UPF0749 family)